MEPDIATLEVLTDEVSTDQLFVMLGLAGEPNGGPMKRLVIGTLVSMAVSGRDHVGGGTCAVQAQPDTHARQRWYGLRQCWFQRHRRGPNRELGRQ